MDINEREVFTDYEKSLWLSLMQNKIYRIVFDFEHSCYRIENDQFQFIYAGDLRKGQYDYLIRELAFQRVEKSVRAKFCNTFCEKNIKKMCLQNHKIITFINGTNKTNDEAEHIRVRIGGTPGKVSIEMCFETHRDQ